MKCKLLNEKRYKSLITNHKSSYYKSHITNLPKTTKFLLLRYPLCTWYFRF